VPRQEKVRHALHTHDLVSTRHGPFPVDTHQVQFNSATAPREAIVLAIVDSTAVTGEKEAFAWRHSHVHPRGFRRRPQASSYTLNRMNKMEDAAYDPPTAVTQNIPSISNQQSYEARTGKGPPTAGTQTYPPFQTNRLTKPVQEKEQIQLLSTKAHTVQMCVCVCVGEVEV